MIKKRQMSHRGQETVQKSQQNPLIRAPSPLSHDFVLLCFTASKTTLKTVESIFHYTSFG